MFFQGHRQPFQRRQQAQIIEDRRTQRPAEAPHALKYRVALVTELLQASSNLLWHLIAIRRQRVDQRVQATREPGEGLSSVIVKLTRYAQSFALLSLEAL